MTICEIISVDHKAYNHLGEEIPTRIEFSGLWVDGKVQVIESHGYSIIYGLKYQMIRKDKPYLTPDEVSRRTNLYVSVYCGEFERHKRIRG